MFETKFQVGVKVDSDLDIIDFDVGLVLDDDKRLAWAVGCVTYPEIEPIITHGLVEKAQVEMLRKTRRYVFDVLAAPKRCTEVFLIQSPLSAVIHV